MKDMNLPGGMGEKELGNQLRNTIDNQREVLQQIKSHNIELNNSTQSLVIANLDNLLTETIHEVELIKPNTPPEISDALEKISESLNESQREFVLIVSPSNPDIVNVDLDTESLMSWVNNHDGLLEDLNSVALRLPGKPTTGAPPPPLDKSNTKVT